MNSKHGNRDRTRSRHLLLMKIAALQHQLDREPSAKKRDQLVEQIEKLTEEAFA